MRLQRHDSSIHRWRCGRTDVGVSAAGQVVSSMFSGLDTQAPAHHQRETPYSGSTTNPDIDHSPPDDDSSLPFSDLVDAFTPADPLPPLDHEFHYVTILNCILPRHLRPRMIPCQRERHSICDVRNISCLSVIEYDATLYVCPIVVVVNGGHQEVWSSRETRSPKD